MNWTKKRYIEYLEQNKSEIELHFHYYLKTKFYDSYMLETILTNKLNFNKFQSAMYGEFVCEGKPILRGFISDLNFNRKMLKIILKKVTKK